MPSTFVFSLRLTPLLHHRLWGIKFYILVIRKSISVMTPTNILNLNLLTREFKCNKQANKDIIYDMNFLYSPLFGLFVFSRSVTFPLSFVLSQHWKSSPGVACSIIFSFEAVTSTTQPSCPPPMVLHRLSRPQFESRLDRFHFSGRGCDENNFRRLENGVVKRHLGGAVVTFECDENHVLDGSATIVCDGHKWNGTMPRCLSKFYITERSGRRRDGTVLEPLSKKA